MNRSVELLEIGLLAWLLSLYSTNPFIQGSRILLCWHIYYSIVNSTVGGGGGGGTYWLVKLYSCTDTVDY